MTGRFAARVNLTAMTEQAGLPTRRPRSGWSPASRAGAYTW